MKNDAEITRSGLLCAAVALALLAGGSVGAVPRELRRTLIDAGIAGAGQTIVPTVACRDTKRPSAGTPRVAGALPDWV